MASEESDSEAEHFVDDVRLSAALVETYKAMYATRSVAELKVMPGCGHWLHAERPRLFNNLVGRFLDAQAV